MSYQYITSSTSPNYTPASETPRYYGMNRQVEGITIHHWGDPANNPQFEGIVSYLCRQNGNTSAHYVATGTGRRVACIVSPDDTAWHSGSAWGNARTIGIELDPRARDEDYDVAAELVADIRSAYGDVPIYWHSYFTSTACPGKWDPYRLDALSYTKFSHATEWGKGGDKTVIPVPTPAPTTPAPLYKLVVNAKQVAAYATDSNAYKGWVQYGSNGKITLDGKDVTQSILTKFAPSPTTGGTNSGVPVADKTDYEELKKRVGLIELALKTIQDFLSSIFSGFKR